MGTPTLHGLPESDKVAENPSSLRTTFEAVYPGQTVCASTASGSCILGIKVAPLSASAGTVNWGEYVTTLPAIVAVPAVADETVLVGLCPCTKLDVQ